MTDAAPAAQPLLRVADLAVRFRLRDRTVDALRGVDLTLDAGESLAVVGESGSGKSTLVRALLGLLPANGSVTRGEVRFAGRDLVGLPERELQRLRGSRIALIPQDPLSNLDPLVRVGRQVAEGPVRHGIVAKRAARANAVENLGRAGLNDPAHTATRYPSELSGGMRQRVLIASAIATGPELLIADEPTSALDVTVQKRILDQLDRIVADSGAALLLVTHDLALAAERAHRVAVMHDGRLVEYGPAAQVLGDPAHEYTRRLVAAVPSLSSRRHVPVRPTEAEPPVQVEVVDLVKTYGRRRSRRAALDGVSVRLHEGRTLGVVGESGSGKSTLARCLLQLTRPDSGRIRYQGQDVTGLKGRPLRDFRRLVQPVFQDPSGSLNPGFSVLDAVTEPLVIARTGTAQSRRERALELLAQVGLAADLIDRPSVILSGGQKQRVAIARALAAAPRTLILDEVVSALDVIVQDQILQLLGRMQAELGLTYVFISHDLAVVRQIADDVLVLHDGRVVESGPVERVFTDPADPYTQRLLASIPLAGSTPTP